MKIFDSISQRKSCRKYNMQQLDQSMMDAIESAIKGFEPLYPDLPFSYRFTTKVKGRFHVEAPHYLIIGGQGKAGETENIGFLFEQLVLWLDAMEIGSVWLGSSKDAEIDHSSGDIIVLAFGHATEPVHRSVQEFKRKPIDTVTNAPDDMCIQAVHLAPSGMNTQPWYLEKQTGKILVYKKKLKPPISLLYKHSDIDMGIALCHYALACKETNQPFTFARSSNLPDKSGYLPFGIIG